MAAHQPPRSPINSDLPTSQSTTRATSQHAFACPSPVSQDSSELYMLLEVALGGELFTILAKRAPLALVPELSLFYIASVVLILSYLHSLRVVYRDLKPENLLLDEQGYLKLVDFGFSKILADRTYTLCGTPEYIAPEVILNQGHDYGVDWWALGILAYECHTNTTPFNASKPIELYRKIIQCRLAFPATISLLAKDLIGRLVCVDTSRRLGCLKGGAADVRRHPTFAELDFDALEAQSVRPPYVPKVKSSGKDATSLKEVTTGHVNHEEIPPELFKEFAQEWV